MLLVLRGPWRALLRPLHTSSSHEAVNKSLLSKLRKKTGFPFVNCRKALEKFNNDIQQAETWLREEAQKEGWAKASKLQSRAMSQGLVGVLVDNHSSAAMVEMNCETDFVARNDKFQMLVAKATAICLNYGNQTDKSKLLLNQQEIGEVATDSGKKIADLVAMEIGNIGENMALRRAAYIRASEGTLLSSYVHSTGMTSPKAGSCLLGKYGAMVTVRRAQPPSEGDAGEGEGEGEPGLTLADLARQLGQHVVGMNPRSVGSLEDPPVADQDAETSLVHQEFLLDTTLSVGDFLQQNGAEVVDFLRFECGEDLPEDDS